MNAKSTKVRLIVEGENMAQDFEIAHAERLLRMRNNGGWTLPTDSQFNFDLENGITIKRHKDKDK